MGGMGSGPRKKLVFTDPVKKLIRGYRSRGYTWEDIANDLDLRTTTPLEDFRSENPEFDEECRLIYGTKKIIFHDKFEKAAIPDDGRPAIPAMANRLAEKYGIINKEVKNPYASFQVNEGAGIQVVFVSPNQPQLIEPEIIDA